MLQEGFLSFKPNNPRSNYLKYCYDNGLNPLDDYLDYDAFIIVDYNTKTFNEYYFDIAVKKTNGDEKEVEPSVSYEAYKIYSNFSYRVLLDSLILHFIDADIRKILNIRQSVLRAYKYYFFCVKDYTDIDIFNFYNTIVNQDVKEWFKKVKYTHLDNLISAFSKHKITKNVKDNLQEIFDRCCLLFKLGTNNLVNPEVIKDGLKKKDKELFDMAMRAGKLAVDLGKVFTVYQDSLSNKQNDLLNDWSFVLAGESAEKYSLPTPKEVIEQKLQIQKLDEG